jgi:predicted nucleotidyltransferase
LKGAGVKSLDSRLDSVKEIVLRLPDLESLYIVGSVAREAQTSDSDLDLVAITRKPTFTKQYSRLLRIPAKVDFNVVSSSLISKVERGETTPYAPLLLTWRRDGVLVHGKDTLPARIPAMDSHARGVFAFVVADWFLWHLVAADNSVGFIDEDFSRRWMTKHARQIGAESMMDGRWRDLGEKLASEVDTSCDPRAICGLFADELGTRIRDLDFPESDERRYVVAKLRSQKKLSWRAVTYETPVQERALRALHLLFVSGQRDLEMISEVPPTISDFVRAPRTGDTAALWNRVQRSVLQELQLILGLGEILVA